MENSLFNSEGVERKKRFPVGAVLLLIYALSLLTVFINDLTSQYGGFDVILLLEIIGYTALAVMLFKKMLSPISVVPIGLITVLGFTNLINSFSYYYIDTFSSVIAKLSFVFWFCAWAMILLVLLCETVASLEKLRKYSKIFKIILFVSVIGIAVLNIVDIIRTLVSYSEFMDYVFSNFFRDYSSRSIIFGLLACVGSIACCIALPMIFFWIEDPYEKENKNVEGKIGENGETVCVGSEFYISLVKHILLLIFTGGIWQMIWIYKCTKYSNAVKDEGKRNPTSALLLYMFIPFYAIYWTYKTAQRIDRLAKARSVESDIATLCLILAIFVPIISPILMQDKINQTITGATAAPKTADNADSLKKYKELLDQGAITEEEYNAKKKELLGL